MLDLLGSDVFMSFSTTVAPDFPLKVLPYFTVPYTNGQRNIFSCPLTC